MTTSSWSTRRDHRGSAQPGASSVYSRRHSEDDDQESATIGTVGNNPSSISYHELLGYSQYQPDGSLLQDRTSGTAHTDGSAMTCLSRP